MNILFLFVSFNGIRSNRGMYGDLVVEFAKKHNVYVLAPSKENISYIEKEGNITIIWVKTLSQLNVGFIKKGLANLLLPYQFLLKIKKEISSPIDFIISPTPPITFGDLIYELKKKYNARFFLILRDIFPQNSVDLKIMRENSLVYKYFRQKEKKLYEIADKIGCMSPGNISYVLEHNSFLDAMKLLLLPNWIDTPQNDNVSENGDVLAKYGLCGKFIAVFGGNLGIAQQPENILDLAKIHSDKTDLVFLIIGKGILKKRLFERIKNESINNVKLIDYIPRTEYNQLIRNCNVGIVSLNEYFTIPNIPSRTLGYWGAKLPVFAMVDKSTDYGINFLDKHDAGEWCIVGDKANYKTKFDQLYYNPDNAKQKGLNGYSALVRFYNTTLMTDVILNSLN